MKGTMISSSWMMRYDIFPRQNFSLHPVLPVFVLPMFVGCGTADGLKRGPRASLTLSWFALSKMLKAPCANPDAKSPRLFR